MIVKKLMISVIFLITFTFYSTSTAFAQPRVVKCKADCGQIDNKDQYSAVARMCFDNGQGGEVTFIDDDIVITQAHVFGINPDSRNLPCCGENCKKFSPDWKKFSRKMYVCDGADYGRVGKTIIGKVIDFSARMTGHPPGYDIAIAHIDRNCSKCNKNIKIKPIPLANKLPPIGGDGIHVHVGDPRDKNIRRFSDHKLIWPALSTVSKDGTELSCTSQVIRHDGKINPPMVFNTSGSPVLIKECGNSVVHGLHGRGMDMDGMMYEALQLVQTQKKWVQKWVSKWTGKNYLLDSCSKNGRRSFQADMNFSIPQMNCNIKKTEDMFDNPATVCLIQKGAESFVFKDKYMIETTK